MRDRVVRWVLELTHPPSIDSDDWWDWYWNRCVPAQVFVTGLIVGVPFDTYPLPVWSLM